MLLHIICHRYLPSSHSGDQYILAIELFKPLNLPLENTTTTTTSSSSSSSPSSLLPVMGSDGGVVGVRTDVGRAVIAKGKEIDAVSILKNKFIIMVDTKEVITSIVAEVR